MAFSFDAPKRVPRPTPKPKNGPKPGPKLVPSGEPIELGDEDIIDVEAADNAVELGDADIEEVTPEEVSQIRKRNAPPPPPKPEKIKTREPVELQQKDIEPPFEVNGFEGLQVAATLEKKNVHKAGQKEEQLNEDNVIADPETGIIGAVDGLGSEGTKEAGARASSVAAKEIPAAFKKASAEAKRQTIGDVAQQIVDRQLARLNITDPAKRLAKQQELSAMFDSVIAKDPDMGRKALALIEAISRANEAVLETGDEKTRGKTTACVGMIHQGPDGTRYAIVANIGDSVAFKRRANGEVVQLTQEDSLLNLMTSAGSITPEQLAEMKAEPKKKIAFPISLELVQAMGGSKKDYERFQSSGITSLPLDYRTLKRAMTRSMGADSAEASLTIRKMEKGDELIIGTDIFDNFENTNTEEMDLSRIAEAAGGEGTQAERLGQLRKTAKGGPKDDDAAIVMARVI